MAFTICYTFITFIVGVVIGDMNAQKEKELKR